MVSAISSASSSREKLKTFLPPLLRRHVQTWPAATNASCLSISGLTAYPELAWLSFPGTFTVYPYAFARNRLQTSLHQRAAALGEVAKLESGASYVSLSPLSLSFANAPELFEETRARTGTQVLLHRADTLEGAIIHAATIVGAKITQTGPNAFRIDDYIVAEKVAAGLYPIQLQSYRAMAARTLHPVGTERYLFTPLGTPWPLASQLNRRVPTAEERALGGSWATKCESPNPAVSQKQTLFYDPEDGWYRLRTDTYANTTCAGAISATRYFHGLLSVPGRSADVPGWNDADITALGSAPYWTRYHRARLDTLGRLLLTADGSQAARPTQVQLILSRQ